MKLFSRFAVIGRQGVAFAAALLLGVTALLVGGITAIPEALAANSASKRLLPVYCTDRDGKVISLTFDAAWGAEDTDTLIEIFDTYDISVTFFVVGDWVDRFPDEVKKLHDAGHEVMNHSDSHPYMSRISAEQRAAELKACNDKIQAITGVRPTLFRPPYGDYDNGVIRSVTDAGMTCVQWSLDSLDWKDPTPQAIIDRITTRAKSGDIVLFHNAAKNTPAALPAIIEKLKADGYTFLKVSDMLYDQNECTINHEGRQCKKQ
ncbi:MAG: polysaccharide deacetylase family protein [Clostridia bacterium]|nr:polysaccharide deacetylase family protein [Clostridia bacterium]